MSLLLDAQPAEDRAKVQELLRREAIHMSVLFEADFLTEPLRLSSRTVDFVDNRWGYTWGGGAGLLIALPNIEGGEDNLAPLREYRMALPWDADAGTDWRAQLVDEIRDVQNYQGRAIGLYGQLFDPETSQPVGHPIAFDTGAMDRMSADFSRDGVIMTLTAESVFSRKKVPAYGMLTYQDQKARHSTDEGLQFTTEASLKVNWTNW